MKMPNLWAGGSSAQCANLHRQAKAFLEEEYQKALDQEQQAFHEKLDAIAHGNANSRDAKNRAYTNAQKKAEGAQRDLYALKGCTCVQWEDASSRSSRERAAIEPEQRSQPSYNFSRVRQREEDLEEPEEEPSPRVNKPVSNTYTHPRTTTPTPSVPAARTSGELALQEMSRDPFSGKEASATERPDPMALLATDPFAATQNSGPTLRAALAEPSDSSGRGEPPAEKDSRMMDLMKEGMGKSVEGKTAFFEAKVAEAQKELDRVGSKTRRGKELQQYLRETKKTQSFWGGVSKLMTTLDYGGKVSAVLGADTDYERKKAATELGLKATQDVAIQPVWEKIKQRTVAEVMPKLFGEYGKRAVAVLGGPAAFAATVTTEVLTPEPTERDHFEIISDASGRTSLADKQRALYQWTQLYDKYHATWNPGEVQRLQNAYAIVYQEAEKQRK
jgi:hypothetical protein